MNVVLIDDEQFSLQYLEKLCAKMPYLKVKGKFNNAQPALDYIEENDIDLIITDIEMPGLTGIEAIEKIRSHNADIGVIFVTGYGQYALQAFKLKAVSYIMKPCTVEELTGAVQRATMLCVPKKRIEIKTFGLFSVSIDGIPHRFANSKAKEMLAYLIDKTGSVVTMEQVIDVLWEERSYDDMVKRLYRKAVTYLNHVFYDTGFFISKRAECYIIPGKANCDYYDLLNNPEKMSVYYTGEYMSQYSWAEATNGKINQILQYTINQEE